MADDKEEGSLAAARARSKRERRATTGPEETPEEETPGAERGDGSTEAATDDGGTNDPRGVLDCDRIPCDSAKVALAPAPIPKRADPVLTIALQNNET